MPHVYTPTMAQLAHMGWMLHLSSTDEGQQVRLDGTSIIN